MGRSDKSTIPDGEHDGVGGTAADAKHRVRGAVRIDPDAASALWHAHRRWVAAILLAHMPREADVEDLLQEVAMRLVQNIERIQGPESLRPWLRTVAINVARTQGRRQRVRRAVFPRLAEDPIPRAPGSERDPGSDERETASLAMALSRNLPDEYREPLILRAVRGLSYRQIADILSLPITTVETRLVRARRMLREQLELAEGARADDAATNSEQRRESSP